MTIQQGAIAPIQMGTQLDIGDIGHAGPGRILIHNSEAIVIYIKDHRRKDPYRPPNHTSTKEWLLTQPEGGNRFHLGECETIEKMVKENRAGRYVSGGNQVNRGPSGRPTFPIETNKGEFSTELRVCGHCIKDPQKAGSLRSPQGGAKNFDLETWLKKASAHVKQFPFKPLFTAWTAPPNQYHADWPKISWDYRKQKNWTCESENCGRQFHGNKTLLHTHHINMQKGDNRESNLKALCLHCHDKEHKGNPYLQKATQVLKNQQNTPPSPRRTP